MSYSRRSSLSSCAVTAACMIFSASTGCGSDADDAAAVVGFLLQSTGGQANGQTGTGGNGGNVYADLYEGGAGTIEVLNTGAVDASFLPAVAPPPVLGLNPLVIAADTVIPLASVEPPIGTAYAVLNLASIFISDGDTALGDEPPVTGLQIDAAATLTLPINNVGSLAASFLFTADIVINGRLTVVDFDSTQRGAIQLTGRGDYQGIGPIETYGTLPGQNGGAIGIVVDGDAFNSGSFSSFGADSAAGDGGDGGAIDFVTNPTALGGPLQNMGQMDSHGGDATGSIGMGGSAGDITLVPYLALWNSGNLYAIGGEGAVDGGDGGDILIAGYYRGELLSSGSLYSNGGSAFNGTAGSAGDIELEAWGAPLLANSTIQALGGNGVLPNATGGNGGNIVFFVTSSDDNFEVPPLNVPAGSMFVSGELSSAGGTAMGVNGTGGNGGEIGFQIDNSLDMGTQSIHLIGYTNLNARGANGYMSGSGGDIDFNVALNAGIPTGPVTIQPTTDASGGYADPSYPGSTGGDGGDITLIGGPVFYVDLITNAGQGETPGMRGTITPLL